jgi:hypothetical protein
MDTIGNREMHTIVTKSERFENNGSANLAKGPLTVRLEESPNVLNIKQEFWNIQNS